MKTTTKLLLLIFVFSSLMITFQGCEKENKIKKIVILQDKPQEWADALKLGFTDGLTALGVNLEKDLIILPKTAMSDPQTLASYVQTYTSRDDINLIYTLGTQTTQEVFNKSKTKPIVFGAVTDPIAAGLYDKTLTKPLANITGTQDLWPYPAQFDLIQKLIPNLKTIGIVYNSSEVNSQVSVEFIKNECKKRGIQLEERTVTSEAEIQTTVSALITKKIDLFFIPADNTAQTSSSSIIGICNKYKIPVFTGISGIVESGAIGTVGTNYYELGKVNAKQAYEVLINNKEPKNIQVAIAEKGDIYINITVCTKLGIKVPQEIIDKAFKKY
ncbi:MAG: ABC transporter substrate-binding protein [Stygiobacter sp.]|nr:MAG: ABC transporter substrate-binding protein [Stygiobacter sp.]